MNHFVKVSYNRLSQLVNGFSIAFHFLFTYIANTSNGDFSVILYLLVNISQNYDRISFLKFDSNELPQLIATYI